MWNLRLWRRWCVTFHSHYSLSLFALLACTSVSGGLWYLPAVRLSLRHWIAATPKLRNSTPSAMRSHLFHVRTLTPLQDVNSATRHQNLRWRRMSGRHELVVQSPTWWIGFAERGSRVTSFRIALSDTVSFKDPSKSEPRWLHVSSPILQSVRHRRSDALRSFDEICNFWRTDRLTG